MAGRDWATLDGYVIKAKTPDAIGIIKNTTPVPRNIACWLPRSQCMDGDALDIGDTDISCREWLAEDRGLDWT